ncbi:monooxygenase [Nocardioides baekrokdamisoli]|uniref:Monooxygenase n=1 Tax=Nocardioides baekrokdamisoli TaxID=1804624 RepID=A0A3G9IFH6_9ACTN|nr:monooxygenase [Nocardioides baekrokdamisoli]
MGAGPYGLSVAAHLKHRGLSVRTFGRPMDTWSHRMPAGMLLKSDGFASSLCAPVPGWTLGEYAARSGIAYGDRDPRVVLELFTEYGLAFQEHFVPDLDQRQVTGIVRADGGFALTLDDGTDLAARRLVVAAGITHFAHVPEPLRGGGDVVSHSSDHRTFERFAGQSVAVVGGGSSAVEVAASLLDAGADVHLLARRAIEFWPGPTPAHVPLWHRLLWPESGIGHSLMSKLCQDHPDLFRLLPTRIRLAILHRHLGPVSGWWVRDKVMENARVRTGLTDIGVRSADGRAVVTLRGERGSTDEVRVDHVIAATGFRPDVDRLEFLAPDLRADIRRAGRNPILSRNFESSVPGLHFVGVVAGGTFGPLLRFMVGSEFAAPRVASHIAPL